MSNQSKKTLGFAVQAARTFQFSQYPNRVEYANNVANDAAMTLGYKGRHDGAILPCHKDIITRRFQDAMIEFQANVVKQ